MRRIRAWAVRFFGLLLPRRRRDQNERDFTDEIGSLVELHVAENVRAGMTAGEARRAAHVALGGVEALRQDQRERRSVPFFEHRWQDARVAARQLRRHPGFTLTALLVLSLGIATSTAIFGFVDAALLRPLPYPNPDRLMEVTEGTAQIPRANLSYLDYIDWQRSNSVFSALDVHTGAGYLLRTSTGPQPVSAARVSSGFFATLGVTPMLGRDFRSNIDRPHGLRSVVLGHGTWLQRFGGRDDVVGQAIELDGIAHTVVGVLPPGFQFAPRGSAELWTPIDPDRPCERRRSCHNLKGIGRLADGVSIDAARAEMIGIARQLEAQYPDSNKEQTAVVTPLADTIVGDVRPILMVLLGGAGLLLVIAAANVASLLLVRTEGRLRELGVRMALGATRLRLASQFVTEATILVASASAIGLVGAVGLMRGLVALIPADMMEFLPFLQDPALSPRVLMYVCGIGVLATILFAVIPIIRLSRGAMHHRAVEGDRGSSGRTWHRLASKLVVIELAVAVVLVSGAGLLASSVRQLLAVELSFNPDQLISLTVIGSGPKYEGEAARRAFGREVLSRIGAVPGVTATGLTSVLPVSFNGNTDWIRFVGRPYNGEHNEVNLRVVSDRYFLTLEAPLVKGRYFSGIDDESHPRVVIINEALAGKYFPGEDPVGQHIGDTSLTPSSIKEIVGVVADIREGALDAEIWPAVYYPFDQFPASEFAVLARTSRGDGSVGRAIETAVRAIGSEVAAIDVISLRDRIDNSPAVYLHRSATWLVTGFAAVAWLLGTVGLYGVLAYAVGHRTREIGVRLALGATRSSVSGLVVREASTLALLGILVGLACAVAAATFMRDLLFGTAPWHAPTLVSVAAGLAASAVLACYLPARRAAAVDPVHALRAD